MKKLALLSAILIMSFNLVSCRNGSSSPPPDGGLTAVAGDGRVTITWAMTPGVDYWLFFATSSSLTSTNSGNVAGAVLRQSVGSPYVVTGLSNGTTYYFTMNGRTGGGPGGAGAPLVSATPRLAGAAWRVGTALANDLRGVTYGASFLAVGATGAMFSSIDGKTWTAKNFVVGTDLNATLFNSGLYLAVGAGGVILTSTDANTWVTQASGTPNDLLAVAGNGASVFVAVGANGTVRNSAGGTTWTAPTSGTAQSLRAVTYANGRFVAVGAAGTVITSVDGLTWTTVVSNTALDLNGVIYGAGLFVATGATGALITSVDGLTWTARTAITTNALNAVTYATQFITVGSNGTVYTSIDGITWQVQTSGTANVLKAIVSGNAGYVAVGAAGTNLTAF